MRLSVLAVVVLVAAAPAWAKPKKKDKQPDPVKSEVRHPVSCPDGAPDQPTLDKFAAGDADAAQAVKGYATRCPSFACRVGKDLYLQGYTYKDSDTDKAIKLLKLAVDLGPKDEECGAKAKPLLAKLSKGRN